MADSSTPKPDDEQHRKFREALERKKKSQHGNPEHAQGATGVRETHNDHHRREFRRKAGS